MALAASPPLTSTLLALLAALLAAAAVSDPATAAGSGSPSCMDQASDTLASKATKEVGMAPWTAGEGDDREDGEEEWGGWLDPAAGGRGGGAAGEEEEGEGDVAVAKEEGEGEEEEERFGLPGTADRALFFQKEDEFVAFSYFLECIPEPG